MNDEESASIESCKRRRAISQRILVGYLERGSGLFGTRAIRNGGEERLSGRFRLARKRLDLDTPL